MMVRVPYLTVSGELRIYQYQPPERHRNNAMQSCRRALGQKKVLHLLGKARWHAGGRRSRVFQNATVLRLIATGEAVREGNVVRARVVERVGFLRVGERT